jgi:copper(I)-binding protein
MRLFTLLLLCISALAGAQLPEVNDYWLQAAPPNATVMAAYGTLSNASDKDIILVDAYSPAFAMTMIHQSIVVDGIAKMIHQDELVIKPNDSLTFKQGSYHIMLMQPKFKINKGDEIKINLIYKNGEQRIVQSMWFPVEFR